MHLSRLRMHEAVQLRLSKIVPLRPLENINNSSVTALKSQPQLHFNVRASSNTSSRTSSSYIRE